LDEIDVEVAGQLAAVAEPAPRVDAGPVDSDGDLALRRAVVVPLVTRADRGAAILELRILLEALDGDVQGVGLGGDLVVDSSAQPTLAATPAGATDPARWLAGRERLPRRSGRAGRHRAPLPQSGRLRGHRPAPARARPRSV